MFVYLAIAIAMLLMTVVAYSRIRPRRVTRLLVAALVRLHPAAVREILYRRRLSFWTHTSNSPAPQRLWGYVDHHSIEPGGAFRLMLATGPGVGATQGHVEIHRIGHYGESDRRCVWKSQPIDVAERGFNNTAAALGPAWPAALHIDATRDWTSGYYSIDFVDRSGEREADAAFIVVTNPNRNVDVLVKLATATYQAYNRWGGHNIYIWETPSRIEGRGFGLFETDLPVNRGDMLAFDRPTRSEFWEWEYYFVLWLEKLAAERGFTVGYATNYDLTIDPAFTSDCKLLVSVGHDEYWSKEEFDATHDRIFRAGGSTLFLGSNTAYWQVRYADVNAPPGDNAKRDPGGGGRQLVCYKSMNDPIGHRTGDDADLYVTARFREQARRPETMLMGVGYQSNLPFRRHVSPRYDYRVVDAGLPFFDGAGLREGDVLEGLIGHEWDNRDPEADRPSPGEAHIDADERCWHATRSRIAAIPRDRIRLVFAGDAVDAQGNTGRAEAVYFESPAGAKVFSAGTNRWAWGLGKPGYTQEAFQRFNRNLVLQLLGRE